MKNTEDSVYFEDYSILPDIKSLYLLLTLLNNFLILKNLLKYIRKVSI